MLKFFKRKKTPEKQEKEEELSTSANADTSTRVPETQKENQHSPASSKEDTPKSGFFGRLTQSLRKTRHQLVNGISQLFLGKKVIDEALLEEIETRLLVADIGVQATQTIIEHLTDKIERKALKDPQMLFLALQEELTQLLVPCQQPLAIPPSDSPFVILMVGVNGTGKTTTIGKLSLLFKRQGLSVMLAAGDTFRAAAVEQLQAWGKKNEVPVIAQQTGADSASVVYDAFTSAKAKGVDVLIADTAGRLHTADNLMEELKKIDRVIKKLDPNAPHETLLVLDAGTGQNALVQAQKFHQAIGVSGLVISKLDGTAKGGIMFAIAQQMGQPIRFIGVGEQASDLRPFDAQEFVQALFTQETQDE